MVKSKACWFRMFCGLCFCWALHCSTCVIDACNCQQYMMLCEFCKSRNDYKAKMNQKQI